MIVKEINIRNFKSFGNNKQSISFGDGELILLCGKNGHGKCVHESTSIDIDIKDISLTDEFINFLETTELGNKIYIYIKETNPFLYEKIKKFKN
jgi:predicted ATP-binding protein involved in virulence